MPFFGEPCQISTGRHLYLVFDGDAAAWSHYKNRALPSSEPVRSSQRACRRGRAPRGRDRMFSPLKAAFALLYLAELISSRPLTTTSSTASRLKLSEITHRIQQLNTGVQVPCNDTRVAQVAFTDRKLSEHDLLCQAATALAKVTRCKNDYEPLIINLKSLHGKAGCSLSTDNEIYLRNFLPELGNFTQALYRRLATTAAN
uniref:Interleukin-4 n=2 Tax=Anas platyrhynchos TaxID=8839 RepID=A0A493TV98_ANAPP|eukprot:XP_012959476.2 uncharacterized protein LOC106018562 [Anas platyrhynchos]